MARSCSRTSEIIFVGFDYPGEVARRIDYGNALIGPGFVDLDALSDLDTTILGFDNQPAWKKGRVWPRSYLRGRAAYEMYTPRGAGLPEALRLRDADPQRHHDRACRSPRCSIANGARPPTSSPMRRTPPRSSACASISAPPTAPAIRSSTTTAASTTHYRRGARTGGARRRDRFCERFEGAAGGLIRTMLAPDRIETCTPELLRRTAAAGARSRRPGAPALLPVEDRVRSRAALSTA